ncbi:MAG: DnaJ C-terminal domain-containing protein [Hyphomicrobium sp.]
MDDPYKILGVPRNASDDQIRQRYKKLVKEFHPDINKSKGAEEHFKKVTSAFDILGDPIKRKSFDRGEINARGDPRRNNFTDNIHPDSRRSSSFSRFAQDDPFGDIFAPFKGAKSRQHHPIRGKDIRHVLEVDFSEAMTGGRKRVVLPSRGQVEISIPSGVNDGQILRMKGQGEPGPNGGQAGDALVEVQIRPHEIFKRVGNDITCNVAISVDEAILGAKINVPTLSGKVQFTLPPGTNSGQMFRLKGKGVFNSSSGLTGDQLVNVTIMLPSIIDEDLKSFITNWKKNHSYDPREKK